MFRWVHYFTAWQKLAYWVLLVLSFQFKACTFSPSPFFQKTSPLFHSTLVCYILYSSQLNFGTSFVAHCPYPHCKIFLAFPLIFQPYYRYSENIQELCRSVVGESGHWRDSEAVGNPSNNITMQALDCWCPGNIPQNCSNN